MRSTKNKSNPCGLRHRRTQKRKGNASLDSLRNHAITAVLVASQFRKLERDLSDKRSQRHENDKVLANSRHRGRTLEDELNRTKQRLLIEQKDFRRKYMDLQHQCLVISQQYERQCTTLEKLRVRSCDHGS